MKKDRIIECPQIKYHISYDENLTLKDLEDLINLIRISNNDALQEMGIPRSRGNDLQRIEKIEPGSIEIIMAIIEAVSNIISVGHFIETVGQIISNKIRSKRERSIRNSREDRKVYEKYELIVSIENYDNGNSNTYIFHIHICNHDSITK